MKTNSFYILVALMLFGCKEKAPELALNLSDINTIGNRHFIIKNIGNAELNIEGFSTSCDCTNLELKSGTHVQSGDSLQVQIVLNNDSVGNESKKRVYITLKTNTTPQLNSFHIIY